MCISYRCHHVLCGNPVIKACPKKAGIADVVGYCAANDVTHINQDHPDGWTCHQKHKNERPRSQIQEDDARGHFQPPRACLLCYTLVGSPAELASHLATAPHHKIYQTEPSKGRYVPPEPLTRRTTAQDKARVNNHALSFIGSGVPSVTRPAREPAHTQQTDSGVSSQTLQPGERMPAPILSGQEIPMQPVQQHPTEPEVGDELGRSRNKRYALRSAGTLNQPTKKAKSTPIEDEVDDSEKGKSSGRKKGGGGNRGGKNKK